MNKQMTARLILTTLLAAMPGSDCFLFAATAVRGSVKIAPLPIGAGVSTMRLAPASNFSASLFKAGVPALMTSGLKTPAPLVRDISIPAAAANISVVPAMTGKTAIAAQALDAVARDAAVIGSRKDASAGDQKETSGRAFDLAGPRSGESAVVAAAAGGSAYSLHALGIPQIAAGLVPFIHPAGMLGGPDSSGPTDAQADQLYEHVRQVVKPGDLIDDQIQVTVSQIMGIPRDATGPILRRLAEQGRVAAFNNGTFIYTDLLSQWSRETETDSNLTKARHLAMQGLKASNTDSTSEHVRALHLFDKALDQYADYGVASHDSLAGNHVATLQQNAYIQVLGDILRSESGVPASREKAQSWLNNSYFSKNHAPSKLDSATQEWLTSAVDAYVKNLPAQAKTPEIASGLSLVQKFVEGLGPKTKDKSPRAQAGNDQLSDGTGGSDNASARKNFPLLEKGDSRVKTLSEYGSNVTGQAVRGELSPLIGRKKEIRQMVKTLLRVEKNNPLVIGEKGVGKTKIIDGLAQMIVDGQIPELAGKNIYKLDLTKIVAGTKYRGEFEERMHKILEEVKASKGQIILFIDEIHRIVGVGSAEGATDASQILKDSLSTGDVAVIGATTLSEYRKIEKDGALSRRFNAVKLEPPSPEEAIEIVMGVKSRYEKKHNVTISAQTVKDAVAAAARYITDRNLPDSVLDLIDDASAEVELKASEAKDKASASREVTSADIGFEISLRTGIPAGQVSADDMELLKSLPNELQKRLVGQDQAVQAVVRAIRRGRLGYRDTKRPVGVFALIGPTGVGKTHLARTLARHLFRSEKAMIRIDMSEYKEKFAMSRLIGAPPGYVGHEGEGQLTEPVRRNPNSVVLFDEIDKADPEVLDLLLQILDDGRITDSQGRVIDFSNTIIMMSANTGGSLAARKAETEKPRTPIGYETRGQEKKDEAASNPSGESEEQRQAGYIEAFKAKMRPEFFNRIGKRNVIVFNTLGRPELEKILEINIADLNGRLKQKNMSVELSAAAKKYLVDDAYKPENRNYGARPLNQTVENELETALVDAEIGHLIANGDRVFVDVKDGTLIVKKK